MLSLCHGSLIKFLSDDALTLFGFGQLSFVLLVLSLDQKCRFQEWSSELAVLISELGWSS